MTTPVSFQDVSWTGTGEVYRKNLSDYKTDAEQILENIENLSNEYSSMPEVRRFALALMPKTMASDDQIAQLTAIGEFVNRKMIYVRDPIIVEYFVSVPKMLQEYASTGQIFGDCDDHVLMFNTLMKTLGFNVRAVAMKIGDSEYYDHVFSQYKIGNRIGYFDGCAKSAPYADKVGEKTAVVPLVQ